MPARAAPLLALALLAPAAPTAAQQGAPFPVKPLRLIVPLAPGGTGDTLGRLIAEKLAEQLGQPVVVENRPGANGQIGTEAVVRAAPDGYTLLMGSTGAIAINPGLYGAKLAFDPLRDLAPVSRVASTASILVVHPALPVKSVKELVALARARPGQLFYSSAGSGSTPHLHAALFASMAGVSLVHVPYKGSSPGRVALASGETQVMIDGLIPSLPLIRAGKLRPLGVTSAARNPAVPEVPTIAEAGVPGYEADQWYGVLAPAAVPREILARLNAAVLKGLEAADLRRRLADQGGTPAGTSPEQFGAFIRAEIAKWSKVIRESGAKPD
jgi:tripartite-type tricarboxylate transporter receptor subunit TctC